MSASHPISERRLAANRANAKKSTGPRTAEGKAAVSLNSLKHGFRARDPSQNPSAGPGDFASHGQRARFVERLRRDLRPRGSLQEILFDRIADLAWQLKRLRAAGRAIVASDRARVQAEFDKEMKFPENTRRPIDVSRLRGGKLSADRCVRCDEHVNRFVPLRRYEASIERSFYRALNELRKRQQTAEDDGLLDDNLNEQAHSAETAIVATPGSADGCDDAQDPSLAEQTQPKLDL